MNLNPAIQNPKAVTGTQADLRKLQKDIIYEKLLKVGIPEKSLSDLSRWQMVALLRHHAEGLEENKQYARGVRYTSKKQQEMYIRVANETFKGQMENLISNHPSYVHEESEDEPDFSQSNLQELKEPLKEKAAKHERGVNASDFTDNIKSLIQDDSRKFIVESYDFAEIKKLE